MTLDPKKKNPHCTHKVHVMGLIVVYIQESRILSW